MLITYQQTEKMLRKQNRLAGIWEFRINIQVKESLILTLGSFWIEYLADKASRLPKNLHFF